MFLSLIQVIARTLISRYMSLLLLVHIFELN